MLEFYKDLKEPKPVKNLELDPKSFGICQYMKTNSMIVQQVDGLKLVTIDTTGYENVPKTNRLIYEETEYEDIK